MDFEACTSLFNNYMPPSQNLPLPPRIYPPFQQLNATLSESTPPSKNIPPFSTTIILCDPLRIHPSLPEYPPFQQLYATLPESTPPSQNMPPLFNNSMQHSHNLPLPLRIYPPFPQLHIILCSPPRIYPSLPEYFSVLGATGRFPVSHIHVVPEKGAYS